MQYFNEQYYLTAKLAQLHSVDERDVNGNAYNLTSLKAALAASGLTPEQHYQAYGRTEGLNPNAYFNESEYLAAKLAQLHSTDERDVNGNVYDLTSLKAAIAAAGLTPAEHYEAFGAFETTASGHLINPSNAFDANAYLAAKLFTLQRGDDAAAWQNKTPADVLQAIKAAGMTPVSHYADFGASEAEDSGIALVQTVPSAQRVANDPLRDSIGENVPANYNPPSAAPAQALAAIVRKPADVGGLVSSDVSPTVVPPAKPVLVPDDEGYIAPPANLADTNSHPVKPPSSSGTGLATDFWVVVNTADGSGTLLKPDGSNAGSLPPGSIQPGAGGEIVVPSVPPHTPPPTDPVDPPTDPEPPVEPDPVPPVIPTDPPVTITLTTETDTISPTATDDAFKTGTGNDIIKGLLAADNKSTLNAADTIDGGKGTDTLDVRITGLASSSVADLLTVLGSSTSLEKLLLTAGADISEAVNLDCNNLDKQGLQAIQLATGSYAWTMPKGADGTSGSNGGNGTAGTAGTNGTNGTAGTDAAAALSLANLGAAELTLSGTHITGGTGGKGGKGGDGGNGGTGGNGGSGGDGGTGGTGGTAVVLDHVDTLTLSGTHITGGDGGDGGEGGSAGEGGEGGNYGYYGSAGTGGTGGTAISLTNFGASAQLTLSGAHITGGNGGDGCTSLIERNGGNGGAAISLTNLGASTQLTLSGIITGGKGGDGPHDKGGEGGGGLSLGTATTATLNMTLTGDTDFTGGEAGNNGRSGYGLDAALAKELHLNLISSNNTATLLTFTGGTYSYYTGAGIRVADGATITLTDKLSGGTTYSDVNFSVKTKENNIGVTIDGSTMHGKMNVAGTGNADILKGGAGDDTLYGLYGADTMDGGAGNDYLDGGSGADTLTGGAGNDYLDGYYQADTLDGGAGNDTIEGGLWGDRLTGGTGKDVFVYSGGGAESTLSNMDSITDFTLVAAEFTSATGARMAADFQNAADTANADVDILRITNCKVATFAAGQSLPAGYTLNAGVLTCPLNTDLAAIQSAMNTVLAVNSVYTVKVGNSTYVCDVLVSPDYFGKVIDLGTTVEVKAVGLYAADQTYDPGTLLICGS